MNKIPLTPEFADLLKTYFQAKQLIHFVYPIVTSYQREILKEINAVNPLTGKPIIHETWALKKEEYDLYLRRCDEEAAKRNLEHAPGSCCPLWDAKIEEDTAKRKLCEYLLPRVPGWEYNRMFDKLNPIVIDERGNYKKDDLGREIDQADEFIDFAFRLLQSQLTGKLLQLVNKLIIG